MPSSALSLALALLLFGASLAHSQSPLSRTARIDARANIFAASPGTLPPFPGGGGLAPVRIPLLGRGSAVQLSAVSGRMACCGAGSGLDFAPENRIGLTGLIPTSFLSGASFRGQMVLVGVFVDEGALTPSMGSGSWSETMREARILNPALHEIFPIGDGLAAGASSAPQLFVAPERATALFLGIADGFAFMGQPGTYADNRGSYSALVREVPALEVSATYRGQGLGGPYSILLEAANGASRAYSGGPSPVRLPFDAFRADSADSELSVALQVGSGGVIYYHRPGAGQPTTTAERYDAAAALQGRGPRGLRIGDDEYAAALMGDSFYSAEIAIPDPLVLVHGIRSSPQRWTSNGNLPRLQRSLMAQLLLGEFPLGTRECTAVNWNPLAFPDGSRWWESGPVLGGRLLVPELDAVLSSFATRHGLPLASVRCDVLAHSAGGLTVRSILSDGGAAAEAIDTVITMGTPHLGASLLAPFAPFVGFGILPEELRGTYQHLSPDVVLTAALGSTRNASFVLVGSDRDRDFTGATLNATLGIPGGLPSNVRFSVPTTDLGIANALAAFLGRPEAAILDDGFVSTASSVYAPAGFLPLASSSTSSDPNIGWMRARIFVADRHEDLPSASTLERVLVHLDF